MTENWPSQVMNREHIYNTLNDPQNEAAQQRRNLGRFLYEQLARWEADPAREREIAYDIAGMLSTWFAASLPDDDPYLEVLAMAGELELPPEHRSAATWSELTTRIQALPEVQQLRTKRPDGGDGSGQR